MQVSLCYINDGFILIHPIQVDEMSECQNVSDIWTLIKESGRKEWNNPQGIKMHTFEMNWKSK